MSKLRNANSVPDRLHDRQRDLLQTGLHRFIGVILASSLVLTGDRGVAQVSGRDPASTLQPGFVDGFLRTLIDSTRNFNPGQPLTTAAPANVPRQVVEARRSLQMFADEAGQLVTALRYEERYSSYLRGILSDALNVKATADVLDGRSQSIADSRQMSGEYARLDQQWRLLSHQLSQTANLSNAVLQRVTRLNQINTELGAQLNLSPQMPQDKLMRDFAALSETLAYLAEDIEVDLFAHPNRDQLRQRAMTLQSGAQQLRLTVENQYPYEDVARYYQQFHNVWLPLRADLRALQNRYIQRNLSRITQINDRIHDHLWLNPVIDGRDILYQAETLEQLVNAVADLLYYDIANRIGRSTQFTTQFRNDIVNRSNLMNQTAKSLQQNLIQQQSPQQTKTLSRQMTQQWSELQAMIAQVPVNDLWN